MATNGKQGEQLFSQIMSGKGYAVQDVSGNSAYWDKDIDFVITSPYSGAVKSFEVKWDSKINRTGNLYLEYSNIHSKGGKGWFTFCQADYIAYGDAISKCFYIVPFDQLKERADQVKFRWAKCGYDSEGQLISLDEIRDIIVGELKY